MSIVVLGAGAVGSLFGAYLSKGNEVILVGRERHVQAICANGLTITGKTDMRVEPRAVTSVQGLGEPELLFITVKSYDTARAIEEAKPLIGPGTKVVSLQNGLGNLEIIREGLGNAIIIGGVTSHGAILEEPGVVGHTGIGDTTVGVFEGPGGADAVARLLNDAGIETSVSLKIVVDVWYKTLVNAAINPLAALEGAPNWILLERDDLKALARDVVSEGVKVAAARGIGLSVDEAFTRVMRVASQTAENRNSMLRDLELGRRTEIDQINGAIARMGEACGIDTPVNTMLIHRIKEKHVIV